MSKNRRFTFIIHDSRSHCPTVPVAHYDKALTGEDLCSIPDCTSSRHARGRLARGYGDSFYSNSWNLMNLFNKRRIKFQL